MPAVEKRRGRDGGKLRDGNAGRGRGGTGAGVGVGRAGVESGEASEFVSALDGALPLVMLEHLQVGKYPPQVFDLREFSCIPVCAGVLLVVPGIFFSLGVCARVSYQMCVVLFLCSGGGGGGGFCYVLLWVIRTSFDGFCYFLCPVCFCCGGLSGRRILLWSEVARSSFCRWVDLARSEE